jgi:hypothetical protein
MPIEWHIQAKCTRYNNIWYSKLDAGQWFSPDTPVSSTIKTDRHDIAEIVLKRALNTIILTQSNDIHSYGIFYAVKLFIILFFHFQIQYLCIIVRWFKNIWVTRVDQYMSHRTLLGFFLFYLLIFPVLRYSMLHHIACTCKSSYIQMRNPQNTPMLHYYHVMKIRTTLRWCDRIIFKRSYFIFSLTTFL